MKLKTFFCENLKKKMKRKTFFVKIWWKKEIVMVYLSQIMPSCVNLNLSSPKMWAKFTHIHFSSPKIWAKNEPRSWVNWKKDHSRSHLPSSEFVLDSKVLLEYKNLVVRVFFRFSFDAVFFPLTYRKIKGSKKWKKKNKGRIIH